MKDEILFDVSNWRMRSLNGTVRGEGCKKARKRENGKGFPTKCCKRTFVGIRVGSQTIVSKSVIEYFGVVADTGPNFKHHL